MASVLEKRVVPVEAAPAVEVVSSRSAALSPEAVDSVAPAETLQSKGEAMMVETRLQLQEGSGAVGSNGQEVTDNPATVLLFPNITQRTAFEMQTPEVRVLTLLHAPTAVRNPGAVIHALRGLSKAA